MSTGQRGAKLGIATLTCLAVVAFANQKQEFRYTLGPGGSVSIVNNYGPVTLKPSPGNEVVVTAIPASSKVEVDCGQTANRVEVHTHFLQTSRTE